MKYKIVWFENGEKKEVISSYFNNLLAFKRQLNKTGVYVDFLRSD